MKKLQFAELIPSTDFEIVSHDSLCPIDKRQKNIMIYYNGSFFKKVNENYEASFINKDVSIKNVFVCSRESSGCRCHFILNQDGNGRIIGSHSNTIEHSIDLYRSERYLFRKHVTTCLEESKNMTPFQIITSYLKKNEVTIYTPCKFFLTSTISKQKLIGIGKLPQLYSELDIEKMKEVGKIFTIQPLDYSDSGGQQHMLVIYSEWQLNLALSSNIFLADSTYKNVPKIFSHLFIVHIIISIQAYPVFFILATSETEIMHTKAFEYLKSLGVSVETIMTDFSLAIKNGVKNVYPCSRRKSCLFHLLQSLIKHVKKNNLGSAYTTDPEINSFIRLFFGLPFIEKHEIDFYLEIIKSEISHISNETHKTNANGFFQYFTDTWVAGKHYSIEDWSQYNDLKLMTNNWSESFNAAISRRFSRSHPNCFTLIEMLASVVNYYMFLRHDIIVNRAKYNYDNYSDIARELEQIIKEKNTLYNNDPKRYLQALANPELRLLMRQQQQFFKVNKIKKVETQQIDEMLAGKRELSFFIEESDDIEMKMKLKKLSIVTSYLNKKRKKYIDQMTLQGKRVKKRARIEIIFDEEESTSLMKEIENVSIDSVNKMNLNEVEVELNNNDQFDENILNEIPDIKSKRLSISEIQKIDDDQNIVSLNNINNNSMIEEIHQNEISINETSKRNSIEKKPKKTIKKTTKKRVNKTHLQRMNIQTKKDIRAQRKMSEESEETESSDESE